VGGARIALIVKQNADCTIFGQGRTGRKKSQKFLQRTLKFPQDHPITIPDRQRTAHINQKIVAGYPQVGGEAAVNGRAGGVGQVVWSAKIMKIFSN
jgi:hypothetical protein